MLLCVLLLSCSFPPPCKNWSQWAGQVAQVARADKGMIAVIDLKVAAWCKCSNNELGPTGSKSLKHIFSSHQVCSGWSSLPQGQSVCTEITWFIMPISPSGSIGRIRWLNQSLMCQRWDRGFLRESHFSARACKRVNIKLLVCPPVQDVQVWPR